MEPRRFPFGLLGATLVTLLGLAFAAWTAWWLAHAESVMGKAGHASYRASTTSKAAGTYTVHVHFTTQAGEHKVVGVSTYSRHSYPEGSAVPIVYDPRLPGGARLDSWVDLWLAPVVLLIWGVWWSYRACRRRGTRKWHAP